MMLHFNSLVFMKTFLPCNIHVHRRSYMNFHDLLNLLNKLGEKKWIKCEAGSKPRKTRPCLTERLLMVRKESNQTNKHQVIKLFLKQ